MPGQDDAPAVFRRRFLGLSALAATAPFLGTRPLRAQTTDLPALDTIPENLKGSGEVRIAGYGGTAQDA
jgi:putative spermidine/putrescine transport system substrate-binding protein